MDEKQQLVQLLTSNGRRIAAVELLLIGVMRVLKDNPSATLEMERTIAEFAGGTAPDAAKKEVIELAQQTMQAAYE
ncbi:MULTISPECIES: hypothetical protein [Xanthomonas]|uniref:hypothetical protein n=1 Tax=Xanthomonas TaxID=338 RepID=UPI001E2D2DC2|nr:MULTISPECIES: hypothetical protein [Xanthomonas]WIX23731.1 hypothetical protein PUV44_12375 [Xanthomonas arboricola pv. corylina]MCC8671440.1 hypothetical protein [Xanthomonas arboricola]MEA9762051.1 hypothetical protein [Xanthomonas campestris pv. raphani]MEA9814655.1 hypothetical protein [Xanthomonas campestris pv. raphani]MEA9907788.1 hypothetical protein [Xanthomonas campestris pv. raphani]